VNVVPQSNTDLFNKEINEWLEWINNHPSESSHAYETKQKEIESTVMPILHRAYQGSACPPPTRSPPSGRSGGPRVEDVD
jgi:hypothetical protein